MALQRDTILKLIQDLSPEQFLALCDRYVAALEPTWKLDSKSFSKNEFIHIGENTYTAFFPYEDCMHFPVPSKKYPFQKNKKLPASATFTILSPTNQIFAKNAKRKLQALLGIEPKIISMYTLADSILRMDSPTQALVLGGDTVFVKFNFKELPLESIFKEYRRISKNMDDVASLTDSGQTDMVFFTKEKTTSIIEKARLNFQDNYAAFSQLYANTFRYFYAFDKLIRLLCRKEASVVLNWRARVTTELIALSNAPGANCALNDNLLHRLIVKIQSEFGNMTYANSCAAGIVMYFFEFCDIGARSEDDYHPKPGSMIDELNSFKENGND